MALVPCKNGLPRISLYEDRKSTIRTSIMIVLVLVPCPSMTSRITLHFKTSEILKNPIKGIVIDSRRYVSFICFKTLENRMLVKLFV